MNKKTYYISKLLNIVYVEDYITDSDVSNEEVSSLVLILKYVLRLMIEYEY